MGEMAPIIVYDGFCGLCNRAIRFVIKRDPQKKFRFIAASSPHLSKFITDQECLKSIASNESIVLFSDGTCHYQSTAALLILKELHTPLRVLYVLYFIPQWFRNGLYSFIATRRYRWFGRYDSCILPDETHLDRFL